MEDSEVNIYTRYGRKQEELEKAIEMNAQNHAGLVKTLELLLRIKSGDVDIANVEVTAAGWTIVTPAAVQADA